MDQAVVTYPTDAERTSELLTCPPHLEVRVGDGYLMNCLTDSLLQCLLDYDVLARSGGEGSDLQWRRSVCAHVRSYLRSHDDVRLRPRERDERNAILPVSEEEHSRAFLEHHRHSAAIVDFLLREYGRRNIDTSCGFEVIVYSRFDGDDVSPEEDLLVIHRSEHAINPPMRLRLYNNTGAATTGYHYDPVFLHTRNVRRRGAVDDMREVPAGQAPAEVQPPPKPVEGGRQRNAKPKARVQAPTFMRVADPFTRTCTDAACADSVSPCVKTLPLKTSVRKQVPRGIFLAVNPRRVMWMRMKSTMDFTYYGAQTARQVLTC